MRATPAEIAAIADVSARTATWPALVVLAVLALLPVGRTSELPVAIGALVGLLWLARDASLRADPSVRLALALFACYWLPTLISACGAVAPAKSWSTVAGALRFAPFAVFVCVALAPTDLARRAPVAVAAILALWLLDAWVQLVTGASLGGVADAERLSGIFGAGNLKLGPVLATLSSFALLVARQRYGRIGLALAFVVLLVPILLAGSRASWLAFAIVALVFAWRETRSVLRFAALAIAAAACVAVAVAIAWHASGRFDARVDRTLLALRGTTSAVDDASAGRLSIWRTAVAMTRAHPIAGVGVRGFRYAYPQYAAPGDRFVDTASDTGASHAHQIVLEVASETGAIGVIAWLVGATLAIRAWRRASHAARERAFAPALALVAMTFPLNTHLAFYSAWWGLLFWWLLALYCSLLRETPSLAVAANAAQPAELARAA